MSKRSTAALALACMTIAGASSAAELAPGAGHSVMLAEFTGTLYYTVEPDGFRVVATLASGAEGLPIRFESTLASGQRFVLSVPRAVGEEPLEFVVVRNGDLLVVSDDSAAAPVVPAASGSAAVAAKN
ncbi:MAG: hypothetical protein ACRED5_10305 [Propylenella sp.]